MKRWAAGEKEEAIAALDWYIERNPCASLVFAYRGIYLASMGKRNDALRDLNTALDVELAQPVPCDVYLRGYRARIAETEALPAKTESDA